jgi:hypothetical protein
LVVVENALTTIQSRQKRIPGSDGRGRYDRPGSLIKVRRQPCAFLLSLTKKPALGESKFSTF